MMEVQKILGISLTTVERTAVTAVYDGSVVVIGKIETIDGALQSWRNDAKKRASDAVKNGVSVFVEEMGDYVSSVAHGIQFSDLNPSDGRPLLSVAFDAYFGLLNAGAIVFAPGTERCRILESAVDTGTDDKGRPLYNVDWQRVKGVHRSMLLCCLAVDGFQPITDGYFESLFGTQLEAHEEINPLERMRQALYEEAVEKERSQQREQRSKK